jgi:hypothetical protein
MESILETKAATVLQFFAGLRGTLWVTFEEGSWSAWLYDFNPQEDTLVVCNPRKNALLKDGNKSDRIDARNLAEWLRGNVPRQTSPEASHACSKDSSTRTLRMVLNTCRGVVKLHGGT